MISGEIKVRPILFNAEMVRAILDGRKTQTRRGNGLEDVNGYRGLLSGECGLGPLGYKGLEISDYYLKPSSKRQFKREPGLFHWFLGMKYDGKEINPIPVKCSYGQPGDRLWVREALYSSLQTMGTFAHRLTKYDADGKFACVEDVPVEWRWKRSYLPSMYMPRWASRITLEIVHVRVERLQEISDDDAEAEGFTYFGETLAEPIPLDKFITCWDQLNKRSGYTWDSNPWVWVIEFRRL